MSKKMIRQVEMVNVTDNHSKVWLASLYDNGDVKCEWGRIGNTLQSKTFEGVGLEYLNKKIDEKLKKNYTIDSDDTVTPH
jgi:serine protease inhibitor ecotin